MAWLISPSRSPVIFEPEKKTRIQSGEFLSTHLNRNLDCRSSHFYFLRRKILSLSAGRPRQVWCATHHRAHLIDPLNGNCPDWTHCFHLLLALAIQYFYGNCSYFGTEARFSSSFYGIIFFFISFLEFYYFLWPGVKRFNRYWNAP